MSQQFNVSPDNLWMAVDYIADFENCCYSLKADRLAFTIQKAASEEIAIDLRQARF